MCEVLYSGKTCNKMDICLGLGLGETMLALMQSRKNSSCTLTNTRGEKSRGSGSSSFSVTRSAPCPRLSEETSATERMSESSDCSIADSSAEDGSSSSRSSSTSSSPTSQSRRSLWGSRKREGRKPAVLEKIPFGKSTEYLTVHVGRRSELSEKYVISRKLLTHPLFQVLLKCSEDEFGEDYTVKKGVAIVCDPSLFLEVVRAVDDDLWTSQNEGEILGWHDDS